MARLRKGLTFVDRLRKHAVVALEAEDTQDPSKLDTLSLWADLNAAADLIAAQKKELDLLRGTSPVVLTEGESKYGSSMRVIHEAGYLFHDYDGESLRVRAVGGEDYTNFTVDYAGEGPVVFSWDEFAQFMRDGFDLMEKLQREDES